MNKFKNIELLAETLLESVQSRDLERMANAYEELETFYEENFKDKVQGEGAFVSLIRMEYARLKYLVYGNFYEMAHQHARECIERIDLFIKSPKVSIKNKDFAVKVKTDIEGAVRGLKEHHENLHDNRLDSKCCLCRKRIANKTGSHMVPNFLAHPSFSFDAEGKRFREALDHHFVNRPELNCSFYGREVPTGRIEQMCGEIPENFKDININQLEFDNEFCSVCEDRWGILETAYSVFYNGTTKSISPRLSYLFWLSVLYRMSLGNMGLEVEIDDELNLRNILDRGICGKEKDIFKSTEDLGLWKYAIFKIQGLAKYGDKGIFGSYLNYPYVIMVNDMIVVFYSSNPTDEQLQVGPITVKREFLNDWRTEEKYQIADRRFFWDVRDWIVDVHWSNYDPPRERSLTAIRTMERHTGKKIEEEHKELLVRVGRLSHPNFDIPVRIRKLSHFIMADFRRKQAEENGETYNVLDDDVVFLSKENLENYYSDLSEAAQCGKDVSNYPFYEEARLAIPDESRWIKYKEPSLPNEEEYVDTAEWYFNEVLDDEGRADQLRRMGCSDEFDEPVRSAKIGRNDPCPCGSGKKYKKCCGRN